MAKEQFVLKFSEMTKEELEQTLSEKKKELCQGLTIEEIDELLEDIEALEFLIKDSEING